MKKLCSNFFEGENPNDLCFPVIVRFRDLNGLDGSLMDELRKLFIFEVKVNIEDNVLLSSEIKENKELREKWENILLSQDLKKQWENEVLLGIVEEFMPLIILDGFDEVPTHYQKQKMINEIKFLTKNLRQTKIVLTCRTGEFNYGIEWAKAYEISPLTDVQIALFAKKWIGYNSDEFINEVKLSPFADTAMKPLSLGHLCAIYERTGSIPEKPKTVYRKVVGLMLEEWDEQRSISRESKFSGFEVDRKYEFLTNLSYILTTSHFSVFTNEQLKDAFLKIYRNFGLTKNDCSDTINEIEAHTGLFLQTGYEKFEFVHKSLQEYLTASYIVTLPTLELLKNGVENLGAELAISVAISSDSTLYFSGVIMRLFTKYNLTVSFYNAFVSRLVIEKPDFYSSDHLTVALFTLIDIMANTNPKNYKYTEILTWILEKCEARVLLKYYKVESVLEATELIKLSEHEVFRLKPRLRIPKGKFSDLIYSMTYS